MAHLTVVQHQNSDVFHALSRIFDAPAVSERRSDAFQITNAADAAARALFIGGDFVYDDSGMIAGGEIENIITFSGDLVAAQIIGTALPAGDIGRFLATPQRNSSDMIRDGLFAGATFDFFSPLAPQRAHKALFLPCQNPSTNHLGAALFDVDASCPGLLTLLGIEDRFCTHVGGAGSFA